MKQGMKIVIAVFLMCTFVCVTSAGAYEADVAASEATLWYANIQIMAAMNDMALVLGWFPDAKEMMKDVSATVIQDLNAVEAYVAEAKFPAEFKRYQDDMFALIAKAKEMYVDIDTKDPEEFNRQCEEFSTFSGEIAENFNEDIKDIEMVEMPDEGIEDLARFESEFARCDEDAEQYREACRLMDETEYDKAYVIFKKFFEEYDAKHPFHDAVTVAMTDCINRSETGITVAGAENGTELSLYLLDEIISRDDYSPFFLHAFYRWRTLEQYYNHGASNMSVIPNKMYNEKRWKLIQIIQAHLVTHPDDVWAWYQRVFLIQLPNIERGGMYGNSNMLHWAALYTDFFNDKEDGSAAEGDGDGVVAEEVVADGAAEE